MSRRSTRGLRFQPAGGRRESGPVVGQKQQLTIERLAHDGRGIAFVQGRSWFVSGALPGEQVRARVLAARSKVVDAIVERVDQPTPQRCEPFCPQAGVCGGCTLQHMPLAEQRVLKQDYLVDQLQRAGVDCAHWLEPLVAADRGYRRRTRLAVRVDKKGQVKLGFRALASQDIVNLTTCPVLTPALQQVLADLAAFVHEVPQARAIGHLELLEGSQVALLVRLVRPIQDNAQHAWREFARSGALQLWWQLEGEPYPDMPATSLSYALPDQGLEIDCRPGDFVQVNAELNQQMVNRALDWLDVQSDDLVLDLFCGLGNFSLPLAQQAAQVTGVEGVASMVQRAQDSAERQGLKNLNFFAADLSQPVAGQGWTTAQHDLVVLDPPREGAQQLAAGLGRFAARKILYVSCNPATLARDAALLIEQGYRLQQACTLDMFSHTGHVEAMALFVKTSG